MVKQVFITVCIRSGMMTETIHVIVHINVNTVVLCRRQLHIFCYILST